MSSSNRLWWWQSGKLIWKLHEANDTWRRVEREQRLMLLASAYFASGEQPMREDVYLGARERSMKRFLHCHFFFLVLFFFKIALISFKPGVHDYVHINELCLPFLTDPDRWNKFTRWTRNQDFDLPRPNFRIYSVVIKDRENKMFELLWRHKRGLSEVIVWKLQIGLNVMVINRSRPNFQGLLI